MVYFINMILKAIYKSPLRHAIEEIGILNE